MATKTIVYDEQWAKELVESLTPLQEAGDHFPCPRCGHDRMNHKRLQLNALSRHAKVYICAACGRDEALRDMVGDPLPILEWGMPLGFREDD